MKLICEPGKGQAKSNTGVRAEGSLIRDTGLKTASDNPKDNVNEGNGWDEDEVTDGYEPKRAAGGKSNLDYDEGSDDESDEDYTGMEEDSEDGNEEEDDKDDEKDGADHEQEESDSDEVSGDLKTDPTDIPWKFIPHKHAALQFWTWTILLPRLEATNRGYGWIFGQKGLCGAIYFDDRQFGRDKGRLYEVALISKADRCTSIDEGWLQVPTGQPIYWVILIEWKGFYAEKKGVGFIHRSHMKYFVPPGRVWKEIVLV